MVRSNTGKRFTWLPTCEASWSPLSQRCPDILQAWFSSCPKNHGLPIEDIASLATPPSHQENLGDVGAPVEIYSIVKTRGKSRWINCGFQISVGVVSSDTTRNILSRSTVLEVYQRKQEIRVWQVCPSSRVVWNHQLSPRQTSPNIHYSRFTLYYNESK